MKGMTPHETNYVMNILSQKGKEELLQAYLMNDEKVFKDFMSRSTPPPTRFERTP